MSETETRDCQFTRTFAAFRDAFWAEKRSEYGLTVADVREFYPAHQVFESWRQSVFAAAAGGQVISARVLDGLPDLTREDLFRHHCDAFPSGYLPPAIRKANQGKRLFR